MGAHPDDGAWSLRRNCLECDRAEWTCTFWIASYFRDATAEIERLNWNIVMLAVKDFLTRA
jgi:hypothetical protein